MSTRSSRISLAASSRSLRDRTSWKRSKAAADPLAQLAAIIGAEGNPDRLEAAAISAASNSPTASWATEVLTKIRRQVGKPDPLVAPGRAIAEGGRHRSEPMRCKPPGTGEVERFVVAEAQQNHRIDHRLALEHARRRTSSANRVLQLFQSHRPRAQSGEAAEREFVVGLDRNGAVVARCGLSKAPRLLERVAAVVQGIGVVGCDRQRPVKARQRFFETIELLQCVSRPRLQWAKT